MEHVTVIIPSYNRRALTARAVRSVLSQAYRPLDVLVIDDASRNDEVYAPAADEERVTVMRRAKNGGVASARNGGVAAARGPFVAFLDSDDYWLPGHLEQAMAALARDPGSDGTLAYAAYHTRDGDRWARSARVPIRPDQSFVDYLLVRDGDIHVNTWVARQDTLARFPFDARLSQSEDWDVVLRMEAAGIRFVHGARPAAVRHVDLRSDRLSTLPDDAMRGVFLAKAAPLLGPRDALILNAALTRYRKSGLENLLDKMRLFLSSPSLTRRARLELVVDYASSRIACKVAERIERHRPAPLAALQHAYG